MTTISCLLLYKPVKKHTNEIHEYTYIYYGTRGCSIRVLESHISICIQDVPYGYGTKYTYWAEHLHLVFVSSNCMY